MSNALTIPNAIRAAKLLLLLTVLALAYLTLVARPEASLLWMELKAAETDSLQADVFFLRNNAVEHRDKAAVNKRSADPDQHSFDLFVSLPRHMQVDGVFFDLGNSPDVWQIERVYIRSRFLLFRLDVYEWNQRDLATQLLPYVENSKIDTGDTLQVTTMQHPYRFYLKLDQATRKQAGDLKLVKAVLLLILLALYLLLSSKYFWQLFTTRKEDAVALHKNTHENWLQRRWQMLAGSGLLLLVMLIMGGDNLLHPGLYIEDSMELTDAMAGNLGLFNPDTYVYYRGYLVFLSEWFVAAAAMFPLSWQPLLYVFIGILVTWLAMNTMATNGLITHPLILLLAPLALFIGSFNIPAMFLTLTGTFFSTTALLMALAIRPAPTTNIMYGLCFLLMCALAWSGPYAPQILPMAFGLILLVGGRRKTLLLACLMLVAVLYTKGSASGMVQFENALDPAIRSHFYDSLVQHIFLFGLVPLQELEVGLVIIALIIAMLVVFRQDRLFVKHSLVLLMSSLVSLMTYFISFKYGQYAGELISAHLVIAQFTWMAFVLLCADRILRSVHRRHLQVGFGIVMVLGLGLLMFAKKNVEAQREKLLPDTDLAAFIESVEYAKNLELANDEFVQLWDVNHQGYITSYRIGATGPAAKSVTADKFPEKYRNFVLPVDLERRDNMLLQLLRDSTIWYSDQTYKELPPELTRYHRNSLRSY